MRLGKALALAALMVPLAFGAPFAGTAQDNANLLNNPDPARFQVYGLRTPPKAKRDATVEGERSLRIAAPGGGNPWTVSLNTPLTKGVKAGDKLVMYYWLRLEKAPEGAATARVPAQIQISKAPYTAIFSGSADVGPEWKLFQITGRADKDYGPGDLAGALHLNSAEQTIDVGAIAILDSGQ